MVSTLLEFCQSFALYAHQPASMIPEILLLVKQIRPRTTQIDNLRATIPVLFETRAFEAVEGVGDTLRVPKESAKEAQSKSNQPPINWRA